MMMADPELTKAFSEHQVKVIESSQKIKHAQTQIEALKRECRSSLLTDQQLAGLPDGSRLYEGIGRMFILTSLKDVRLHLKESKDKAIEKIKSHEANISYLEKALKESEESVRELVSQKRK